MVDIEYRGKCTIGENSQRMLLELAERDEVLGTGDLRDVTNWSENALQKVRYRLKKKLLPAGLVRELERITVNGQEKRQFEITAAGEAFVEEHEDILGAIPDHEEIAEEATKAKNKAESAKDSVQNYRQKVDRIKDNVEELEDDLETLEKFEKKLDKVHRAVYEDVPIYDLGESVKQLDETTETLRSDLSTIEDEIDSLASGIDSLSSDIEDQEEKFEDLQEDYRTFYEEFEEFRASPSRAERLRSALASLWAAVVFLFTLPGKLPQLLPSRSSRSSRSRHPHNKSGVSWGARIKTFARRFVIGIVGLVVLGILSASAYSIYTLSQPFL